MARATGSVGRAEPSTGARQRRGSQEPHVVLVAPPLSGHLNPMLTLGRALRRAGVEATYVGPADCADKVVAADVGFYAVGAATHPIGHLSDRLAMLSTADTQKGMTGVIDQMVSDTAMLVDELPDALATLQATAVIVDQLEPAGALSAQRLERPYASLASALPINRDPITPPYFTGWKPKTLMASSQVITGAERVYDWMTRAHGDVISKTAAAWGLREQRTCQDTISPWLDMWQIAEAYDFPRAAKPSAARYVGPLRDHHAVETARDDDRAIAQAVAAHQPLIFASFGTLFGDRFDVFAAIAQGAAAAQANCVIAHGGKLSDTQVERLEAHGAIVRAFVHQRELLPHCSVCVTHGGMNTTMDALTFGVPVLAMPVGFDQKANAARCRFHGAGLDLPPSRATSARVERALRQLLDDRDYRMKAGNMSSAIRATGGTDFAVALVTELVFGARV